MKVTLSLADWKSRCDHGVCSNGVCAKCFTVDPVGSDKTIDPRDILSSVTAEVGA